MSILQHEIPHSKRFWRLWRSRWPLPTGIPWAVPFGGLDCWKLLLKDVFDNKQLFLGSAERILIRWDSFNISLKITLPAVLPSYGMCWVEWWWLQLVVKSWAVLSSTETTFCLNLVKLIKKNTWRRNMVVWLWPAVAGEKSVVFWCCFYRFFGPHFMEARAWRLKGERLNISQACHKVNLIWALQWYTYIRIYGFNKTTKEILPIVSLCLLFSF